MSTNSSLDRESFQQFLASAFAVQESQMDSQFLAAIMEVQRMVTRGELGVDGSMNLVVDSARDVANADGVAVCLLEADQLIYRAGSGCSATCVGSRVTASLTVPANTKTGGEILRVENAQTDTRIRAAVCRQFGAKSLLMLPIYHKRVLAGVLEVLFSEAHAFQDREVYSYRLMAGLIEAAMVHAAEVEQKNRTAELATTQESPYLWQGFLSNDESMLDKSRHAIYQHCGAALSAIRKSQLLKRPSMVGARMVHRAKESFSHNPPWNVLLAAFATVLGVALWIAYGRGPASPLRSSAPPESTTAIEPPDRLAPVKAMSMKEAPEDLRPSVPLQKAGLARSMVRRARAGENEVDYIGDDVTVRHFSHKPNPRRRVVGASRVANVGEDVTVRYFITKPAVKSESR
jgi:GAF domain